MGRHGADVTVLRPPSTSRHEPIPELGYGTLDWGEGWAYTVPPRMDTLKWLSSGRHMVNICDRWQQNKATLAATAWFNGIGMESWENAWGTWNGMTPRDSQIYARLGALMRFFGGHTHGGSGQDSAASNRTLLSGAGWRPYSPVVAAANGPAYASTFPSDGGDEVLIAVVGYGGRSAASTGSVPAWMPIDRRYSNEAGYRLFDCWAGAELPIPPPHTNNSPRGAGPTNLNLTFALDASLESHGGKYGASGFGALLLTRHGADPTLQALLAKMRAMATRPLGAYSCEGGPQCEGGATSWPFYPSCNTTHCAGLTQTMKTIPPTRQYGVAPVTGGGDMVQIPGSKPGGFLFVSNGVEWRGAPGRGVGVQWPWEPVATRSHSHNVTVPTLWADRFPVTNARYHTYLVATGYVPADRENWLRHWGSGNGAPAAGTGKQPVRFVSVADARAFCGHYGKRLPHAWEWNWVAGQAVDGMRLYPWGDAPPDGARMPATGGGVGENRTIPGPADVDAHPDGCSPQGVCDVLGNTWEYTDEFADQHSRAVVLKGGSNYHAAGSSWYFPNALRLDLHEKMFLMNPGWERAGTAGFRCVADSVHVAPPPPPPPTPPPPPPCLECEAAAQCLCVSPSASADAVTVTGAVAPSANARDWLGTAAKSQDIVHRAGALTGGITFGLVKAQPSGLTPYCCSPLRFGWSDGAAPAINKAPSGDGLYLSKAGAGFSLSVPMTAQARNLTVFMGCFAAKCRLQASVEGSVPGADGEALGSALPPPQVRGVAVGSSVIMYRYEVVVKARTGTTLVLTWTKDDGDDGHGNVTFEAAVLQGAVFFRNETAV